MQKKENTEKDNFVFAISGMFLLPKVLYDA